MSKLEAVKKSARELKNAVTEFEVTNAALMGAIEKKYSTTATTATNATAPATTAGGRQFVSNDILANYERV